MMPNGYDNLGVRAAYADAKSKGVFDKKQYALFNQQEFFGDRERLPCRQGIDAEPKRAPC